MLIDKYLPVYHFHEFHSVKLHGSFDGIFNTMLRTDLGNNSVMKIFFRLRGMGAVVYSIERLTDMGFIKLHEAPGEEIIFGMITDSPMFNTCLPISSHTEFIQYSDPATIKAVINFSSRR